MADKWGVRLQKYYNIIYLQKRILLSFEIHPDEWNSFLTTLIQLLETCGIVPFDTALSFLVTAAWISEMLANLCPFSTDFIFGMSKRPGMFGAWYISVIWCCARYNFTEVLAVHYWENISFTWSHRNEFQKGYS